MTVAKAREFAREAHRDQKRKYTGEPYYNHCFEVRFLVSQVEGVTPEMEMAALLHDTVEDTGVTLEQIRSEFGVKVMEYVTWLTDVSKPSDGNRKVRKEIDRQHTAAAPPEVKTIKLADLISNTSSIVGHDPAFAKVYMAEKRLLLEVLTDGDPWLYKMAKELVDDYFATAA